ncbi:AAA family ATPase [uncultured virus]|nr:AAA family ATPase [uncultured virus]
MQSSRVDAASAGGTSGTVAAQKGPRGLVDHLTNWGYLLLIGAYVAYTIVQIARACSRKSHSPIPRLGSDEIEADDAPGATTKRDEVLKALHVDPRSIGGLATQTRELVRRVVMPRRLSERTLARFGVRHPKGVVLHGPPGCGKTLLARHLASLLPNVASLRCVQCSDVFNKFVGESEARLVRLFANARAEHAARGARSGLHVFILDEFEVRFVLAPDAHAYAHEQALCARRSDHGDAGSTVGNRVVNVLLSTLDGPTPLPNVLLIGTTNRLDMVDSALLRPGRFEVLLEIPLPGPRARLDILRRRTAHMRRSGALAADVDLAAVARSTRGWSGADLDGLVSAAVSLALEEHRGGTDDDDNNEDSGETCVTDLHVRRALENLRTSAHRTLLAADNSNSGGKTAAAHLLSLLAAQPSTNLLTTQHARVGAGRDQEKRRI